MEEIYDDVFKFYFAQNYLEEISPIVRKLFTGENAKAQLINYATPFVKLAKRYSEYKREFEPHFTTENLGGKVWLFIASQNNRSSLKFLLNELDDAVLVGYGVPLHENDKFQIPFHLSVLNCWKFPKLWYFFYKKYGNQAVKYGDFLFKNIGLYEVAYNVLAKHRPRCLVLANDHSEKQRALLNAARRLDIPVVYIQHASISDFMPPLDFNLSLLEGQGAWDKYKKIGDVKGDVKLIGMPKFDDYIQHRNFSTTVKNIGICINYLDLQSNVTALVNTIQSNFPNINISFRPHPGDKRVFEIPDTVRVSTKKESIFDFLKHQDVLIAGSSSVHLEAILLNVTSIYFEITTMQKNIQDVYGYVENGLVNNAANLDQLIHQIKELQQNRPPVFQKSQYYNATVGTPNEGKSSSLAGQFIKDFLNDK